MKFELIPIIDTMMALYAKPRTPQRFHEYISILGDGKKGDLTLPIGGFNPMAKEHVLEKLGELKNMDAEKLMQETFDGINVKVGMGQVAKTFKVVLNLADDLKGGWTNRYTTDYDSKFKVNALVTRNFCTPFFWTSEDFTEQLIKSRTVEYVFRTIYWTTNPKPKTLKDHIDQEAFVAEHCGIDPANISLDDFETFNRVFEQNMNAEDYGMIFNFLYGDKASASLGFTLYGMTSESSGFDYARMIYARKGKVKSTKR